MLRTMPAWLTAVGLLSLVAAGTARAQVSTATIQGKVSDATGVLPGATVTAREVQSGFTDEATSAGRRRVHAGRAAAGTLRDHGGGLAVQARSQDGARCWSARPSASTSGSRPTSSYTEVGDGRGRHAAGRHAHVRGHDQRDRRSSCATCRRTRRNFLNFAALAPGVRVSDNEFRKEFSAGALPSPERQRLHRRRQLQERRHRRRRGRPGLEPGQPVPAERGAGVPGPDPELQGRVREGRERDHHRRHQERRQPLLGRDLQLLPGQAPGRERGDRPRRRGAVRARARRRRSRPTSGGSGACRSAARSSRTGCSSSAPTRRTGRTATASVLVGTVSDGPGEPGRAAARLRGRLHEPVPREAAVRQGRRCSRRRASRRRSPTTGATRPTSAGSAARARATASRPPRTCRTGSIRSRASGSSARARFLNEAYVSYQRYRWNPKPENPDVIGENFEGLLRIGGRDTEQFIVQQRMSLRDDFSRFLNWAGSHTAKAGGIVSFVDYDVQQAVQRQPAVPSIAATSAGTSRRGRNFGIGQPRPERRATMQFGLVRAGRLGGRSEADAQPRACGGTTSRTC